MTRCDLALQVLEKEKKRSRKERESDSEAEEEEVPETRRSQRAGRKRYGFFWSCRFKRLWIDFFSGCNNTHFPAGCALALRTASPLARMTSAKSRTSLRVSGARNPQHDSLKIIESHSFQFKSRALSPHCHYTTGGWVVIFFIFFFYRPFWSPLDTL